MREESTFIKGTKKTPNRQVFKNFGGLISLVNRGLLLLPVWILEHYKPSVVPGMWVMYDPSFLANKGVIADDMKRLYLS